MKQEWFEIKDLENFINATRRLVFQHFGQKENEINIDDLLSKIDPKDQTEMDTVLSYQESLSIAEPFIRKQISKYDKNKVRYLLSEDNYMLMIESLNDRLVSNILNSLVNKGLIETAYDEKCNDFVFWINNKIIGEDNNNE